MTAGLPATDFTAYSGSWPYWRNRYASAQGLLELMSRSQIGRAVAASTRSIFVDAANGNDEVAALARQHPEHIVAFGSVNPLEGNVALAEVQRCATSLGMKGLRLYPAHHGYRLKPDPVLDEVLGAAGSLGLIVALPVRLIMTWGLPTVDLQQIGATVARFPRCTFVLGGVNYGELRDALELMRDHRNLYFETSCFQTLDGIRLLVDKVGAERVLLGIGLPLQYPSPGLHKLLRAKISDREKELIANGNASRLLGEEVP